ncbi:MAG: pilus assembly protein [Desulfarculaceae bacterium]|nr:pilus assembly protein [Desulfarculaceae bacterium]MCF8048614.1 pilus assembly protein [Desulfarculaceae bacterium]MCF8063871.1 pilus assembly protein [Desulfarculaceae bacterium]MCF8096549.1 pilus assembly protein [Desulfarculaceae bacterium]MCF8124211.1 pilus assembly protein [Desulfarculaceae bacterium]
MKLLRRLHSERASVAVEFALFLPVFLLLVFSVVELGSAWYAKQMLVNASRDGARMASLLNPGDITDADVETHVQTLLTTAGFPGSFTVTSTGAEYTSGTLVTVQVDSTYELPMLGALIPASLSEVNLSATTVMRHE